MTSNKKIKVSSFITVLLLAAVVIHLTVVMGQNHRVRNQLHSELLNAERLLSEKLQEQKKNAALRHDFISLEKANANNLNKIDSVLMELALRNAVLKKAHAHDLQNKIITQGKLIEQLNRKLHNDSIKSAERYSALKETNDSLEKDLIKNAIESQMLLDEIDLLSTLKISGAFLEVRDKRNKLTTKAAKARQLKIVIQISDQVRDLNLKIVTPAGIGLPLTDTNSSVTISDPNPSTEGRSNVIRPELHIDVLRRVREVEFTYRCNAKLTPGIYSIHAFNGDLIGSLNLHLD